MAFRFLRACTKIGLIACDDGRTFKSTDTLIMLTEAGIFRARSLRINSDMLVVTAGPARTALKNSELTGGDVTIIIGTARWSCYRFQILTLVRVSVICLAKNKGVNDK